MNNNFLFDDQFLLDLDNSQEKEVYAKIIALTKDELPIEHIEGRVTGGSVNVDGTSAVRRTCSLSMVAKDVNINDFYWGLKNKFKLEIGLKNKINPNYPNIIWFKMGTYAITSFSTSLSTNTYNISISGKDKMCLLNGDLSGSLPHNTDFGTIYNKDADGNLDIQRVPIKEIIFKAVQELGGELASNISINDIEDNGLDLLEYKGDKTLYLLRNVKQDIITNLTLNPNQKCFYNVMKDGVLTQVENNVSNTKETHSDYPIVYDNLFEIGDNIETAKATEVLLNKNSNNYYTIAKGVWGRILGYRETELVYPGDLIANVGETITSVLDKLVNMLGDFEYFYDLDGRFIFRRKPYYVSSEWEQLEKQTEETASTAAKPVYNFVNSNLINSFNNNPNLLNVRNDYAVWGHMRNEVETPIHARYAIDKKPNFYKAYDGITYISDKRYVEKLKEQRKKEIILEVLNRVNSFVPTYSTYELPAPVRQSDGSFSAGWWDIRDWAEYYKILTKTTEDPNLTMKWYSKNNLEGCVPMQNLDIKYTTSYYESIAQSPDNYVWLLIRNKNGKYNPQHGYGNPFDGKVDNEVLYKSYYDENGKLITKIATDENNNRIYGKFINPYKGCSENHTYLVFLTDDVERQGNTVFFYNPNFPGTDSYEEVIQEQIEKEFEEYFKEGLYQIVDWREIIYQMAKDYRKYYHSDDNFLFNIAQNNLDYYPSGKTGYEQYYIDMEGFWRDLYNPNPDIEFYNSITDNNYVDGDDFEEVAVQDALRPAKDSDLMGVGVLNRVYVRINDIDGRETFIPFLKYCTLKEKKFNYKDEVYSDEPMFYYYLTAEGKMNTGTQDKDRLSRINMEELYIQITDNKLIQTEIYNVLGVKSQNDVTQTIPFLTAETPYQIIQTLDNETGEKGILITSNDLIFRASAAPRQLISFGLVGQEENIVYGNKIKYIWQEFLFFKKKYPHRLYVKDEGKFVTFDNINETVRKIYTGGKVDLVKDEVPNYDQSIRWVKRNCWGEPIGSDGQPLTKNEDGTYDSSEFIYNREIIPWRYGYYLYNRDKENSNYWSKMITKSPESLIFWIDFLDSEYSELGKFSVPAIGIRSKSINDDDVKTIYYRDIPNVIFKTSDMTDDFDKEPGYSYIQLQGAMQSLFTISSKGKSAKERIDELLYEHACTADSINITALPVYYLEPNNKIFVRDDKTNINGEYIISRLTYNLNYNGTMSIQATKTIDSLT